MGALWAELDSWTRKWLVAAVAFGAALPVAAETVPFYSGTNSLTLVQANGVKALYIVGAPLVGTLIVISNILIRRRDVRSGVSVVTWLIIGALGTVALLGMLTVGPFILPVPVCLLVAALRVHESRGVKP
jgi:hypothetical protein